MNETSLVVRKRCWQIVPIKGNFVHEYHIHTPLVIPKSTCILQGSGKWKIINKGGIPIKFIFGSMMREALLCWKQGKEYGFFLIMRNQYSQLVVNNNNLLKMTYKSLAKVLFKNSLKIILSTLVPMNNDRFNKNQMYFINNLSLHLSLWIPQVEEVAQIYSCYYFLL